MSVSRKLPAAIALFAAAMLAACATDGGAHSAAAPAPGTVDEARLQRFFTLMDEDGSDAISRPEFQAGKGSVFMAMDADGSMTLTPNETRLSPEAFALLAGADNTVDGEEFIAADVAQFEKVDKNRDLEITYEELRDYLAKFE